jgi:putative ABC transport system substrate-binding protein
VKRREFITLLGGAAAAGWPFPARAQQPTLPVIGYLNIRAPGEDTHLLAAFREGLKEAGYIEGKNVAVAYRYAANQYEKLPELAADLVRRQVMVIAALGGAPAAPVVKHATSTIPIVTIVGVDPVQTGLVASLNRPGGNLTGVSLLNNELAPKLVQLLHELLPKTTLIGFLVNPTNPAADSLAREVTAGARTIGQRIHVLTARNESDFEPAFATLVRLRADALLVQGDPFFNSHATQLVALAARDAMPAIYPFPEYVAAGGLMSYGSSLTDGYRQAGIQTGRILKGEKPADLPFQQLVKIELIINLKATKTLGLSVPTALLVRADEVIE